MAEKIFIARLSGTVASVYGDENDASDAVKTLVPENRAARFNSAQRGSQAPIWYRFQLERGRYPGNQSLVPLAVCEITWAGWKN